MRHHIITVTAAFGLAACADTPPDEGPPRVVHEAPVSPDEPARDEEGVEVAEIPTVPAAAVVGVDRAERICTNERRTGTNRVTRVCRTRAEVERQQAEGREIFDDLHKSQQEY